MVALDTLLEKDVEKVSAIEKQLYFRPWSDKSFLYACQNYLAWLVLKDGDIVGYAIFDQIDEESQLLNFSIAPEYHNQGIGQQALSELLKLCYESLQIKIIYLEVNCSNQAAIHLYKKLGFVPMGRRLGYYMTAEGREDAITMYHSKSMLIV